MKIIGITEFTTTAGTGKKTTIPLDTRSGVYFSIITGTFETPLFSLSEKSIPVLMLHGDREQKNVSITVENNSVIIEQGYRQASHGFLISKVNNDWADTNELKPVYIDSLEIISVKMSSGETVTVTTSISDSQVRLRTTNFTPTTGTYHSIEVTTKDGKTYYGTTFSFTSHRPTADITNYDYATANVERALRVFEKP